MDVENPSAIRAKGSRTKTRKVRTGCITCKKRHVKCDEAKPSCSNCLKSRGLCEGYAIEPRKHPGIRRAIQARPDQNPQPDTDWPLTSMVLDPVHHDFPDPLSLFYFREFISLLQDPWMTGLSNSQGCLWRETLPQVCRTNHTLRNAAMAVGAMGMFRKETTLRELDISTQSNIADTRYLQALAYYGKALQLQSQRASFQSSAFLSLILLIFESLRLRKMAALDHTNHGMALLLSFLGDRTTSSDEIANFSPNPRPILGQLADIFMHLATQTRIVLKGRIGQHCPLPDLAKGLRERGISMEDFIVLLSQVSTSKHCITPQIFSSLDEFEEHWISMTRRQAEMGPIMLQAMMRSTILECEHQQQISDLFASTLKDPEVQKFCDDTRRGMDSMEQAFLPLFSDIMMSTTMDSPTYLRALYLRLRFLSVQVFSNPPQYACIQTMVALTPRLREFLSLAELAIRITRKTAVCRVYSLCIDGGLAWYLLQIALHCRDPLLRDEAILALEGYAGQYGLWTTRSLHALALRNRIVEQQNANEDTAQVQWQRLWRREYYLEDGGERVVFRFLEKEAELDQWILVEEVGEFQDKGDCAKWTRQPNPQSGRLLVQEGFPASQKDQTGQTPQSKCVEFMS